MGMSKICFDKVNFVRQQQRQQRQEQTFCYCHYYHGALLQLEKDALFSTSCKLLYFFSKIVGPLLLEKKVPTTLSLKRHWKNNSIIFHVRSFRPETEKVIVFIKCQIKRDCSRRYRRLLLKLDKQISGTIYQQQTRHRAWRGGDASLYADFHHQMSTCLFVQF